MALINDITKLGRLLVRQKIINTELLNRLENAARKEIQNRKKHENKKEKVSALRIIESLKLQIGKNRRLDEKTVLQGVAKEYNLEFKKLDPLELDADIVTGTIPKPFALKHLVVPLYRNGRTLTVAVTDPEQRDALEQINMVSGMELRLVIATQTDIENTITQFFSFSSSVKLAEKDVIGGITDMGNLEQLAHIKSEDEISSTDKHIQNAVDSLLRDALAMRSSDIHIEPKRNETMVRNRIDGVLMETHKIPKVVHKAVISRIKLLSRLDISEKRRPQDGRFKVTNRERETEMRVSILPVAFGEKVVIRIFDYKTAFKDLGQLGFYPEELTVYKSFLKKPHGIVLVTGPTGSGKTSTLYSSLKYLNSTEKNIVTIEDPIEMVVPDFNQVGIQRSIDLTFASALRSILRQDPDVIMIGEIRDSETAENAVHAALTGHLVISTLHTNDTVSSLTRLFDLGIEPYLIKTSLIGILSQRLVRVICDNCKKPFHYPKEALTAAGVKDVSKLRLHMGTGCEKCRLTGYYGRKGVHELLEITEEVRNHIDGKTPEEELRRFARKAGMKTIQENALRVFTDGETTLEEILKLRSNLF